MQCEYKGSPLVSVIVPCYNSEKFIEKTLNSILLQDLYNLEVIVVDDCSTDKTNDLVLKLQLNDLRIKFLRNNINSGVAKSRNRGIEIASGRYIAFCDSDDIWQKSKLSIQIDHLLKYKIPFTCSAYYTIDANDQIIGIFTPPEFITYSRLLLSCPIGTSTVIYDTHQLGKLYMPNLILRQDYLTWLNLFKKIKKTSSIQEKLVFYRLNPKGVSRNKLRAAFYHWSVLKIHGLSIYLRVIFFFIYIISGTLKHYNYRFLK